MTVEKANAAAAAGVTLTRSGGLQEQVHAEGRYVFECYGPDGQLKWRDEIDNLVTIEGGNALLHNGFRASGYTATQVLGLIESTGYTAVAAGNTAAAITANGTGSPANGWNEAPSTLCASRGTPSFAAPSARSMATSAAVSFSIIGSGTLKGAFLLCRSIPGVAPTTTVGNTSGALYSAGLFTGGDRAVANGDTVNVSYTASL